MEVLGDATWESWHHPPLLTAVYVVHVSCGTERLFVLYNFYSVSHTIKKTITNDNDGDVVLMIEIMLSFVRLCRFAAITNTQMNIISL